MVKKTHIAFLLDETGSMSTVRDATISGFNEYLQEIKRGNEKNLFSLYTFDVKVRKVRDADSLESVTPLEQVDYQPSGMTALYDSIAYVIRDVEQKLEGKKRKPSVMLVIMTDGEENSSKEYTREKILDLIQAKEQEGWAFTYLGANQDAWKIGQSIGISGGNTSNYAEHDPADALKKAAFASIAYMKSGGQRRHNLLDDQD